jgi:hypothetical protein
MFCRAGHEGGVRHNCAQNDENELALPLHSTTTSRLYEISRCGLSTNCTTRCRNRAAGPPSTSR